MPWLDHLPSAERRSPREPVSFEPARLAVVATAVLAAQAVASVGADPVGAAEGAFLALLAGGVLAALSYLAPSPAYELPWTALLVVTAIWIVGYGPHRGTLVTLLLLVALALAAWRAGRRGALADTPGPTAALALGAQLLVRSDLLLPPLLDLRTLVSVLALPVASGVALHLLARRLGAPAAWIAGTAVFALSPGWNVTVTLALTSLAAGTVMADRELGPWERGAAAVALCVPPVWDPALGTLFAIGGLTFLVEGRLSWLLSMAGIAVLAWSPPARFGRELLEVWSLGLVLLPAAAVAAREGRHLVLRGALLSLLAAVLGGGPEDLAGGLALAAFGLAAPGRSAGRIRQAQSAWSTLLALGTALVATYPWMREESLASFLELLGLREPRWSVGAALAAVLAIGGVFELLRRSAAPSRRTSAVPALALGLVAVLAVARAQPSTALVPISFKPVVLATQPSTWFHRFPVQPIGGGVIDCHLVHGAELAAGTRVARVRLRDAENRLLGDWDLVAGFDTAEWAAARPDVAGRPGFLAPAPWLRQIAPEGTFFSQRFRARFHLEEPLEAATIAVRRDAGLPPGVELRIYYLELRR